MQIYEKIDKLIRILTADLNTRLTVPPEWEKSFPEIEKELRRLTENELYTLAIGETREIINLAAKCPLTDEFIEDLLIGVL